MSDPLKERIAELLRCLENDWHIHASWDGLRKFWCIELTEEGVRLRDAELGSELVGGEVMSEYIYATNGELVANIDGDISLAREKIVRCLDCKHFTPKGTHKFKKGKVNADYCKYVRGWMLQITPDGYCAWGERKEA